MATFDTNLTGKTLGGRWRLVRQVGAIYEAQGPLRGAVQLFPDVNSALFEREIQTVAALDHPNIARVYDAAFDSEAGVNYLVTEWLPGGSLDVATQRTPSEIALIIKQIAAALDYAHDRNLLHLDVREANILFDDEKRAVLTDFTLPWAAADSNLTGAITLPSNPTHTSPEQITGATVTRASDQYSLAVVAWHQITVELPFNPPEGTFMAFVRAHTQGQPTIPWNLAKPIADVLLKALAKTPADRYPTATAFASALESALIGTRPAPPKPKGVDETFAEMPLPPIMTATTAPPAEAAPQRPNDATMPEMQIPPEVLAQAKAAAKNEPPAQDRTIVEMQIPPEVLAQAKAAAKNEPPPQDRTIVEMQIPPEVLAQAKAAAKNEPPAQDRTVVEMQIPPEVLAQAKAAPLEGTVVDMPIPVLVPPQAQPLDRTIEDMPIMPPAEAARTVAPQETTPPPAPRTGRTLPIVLLVGVAAFVLIVIGVVVVVGGRGSDSANQTATGIAIAAQSSGTAPVTVTQAATAAPTIVTAVTSVAVVVQNTGTAPATTTQTETSAPTIAPASPTNIPASPTATNVPPSATAIPPTLTTITPTADLIQTQIAIAIEQTLAARLATGSPAAVAVVSSATLTSVPPSVTANLPTTTPLPPTATRIPPTITSASPTLTSTRPTLTRAAVRQIETPVVRASTVPPTATRIPSTVTPLPPTRTPIPPTATSTPIPPTVTAIPPTPTSLPPTSTRVVPTRTPLPLPPTSTTNPITPTNDPAAIPLTNIGKGRLLFRSDRDGDPALVLLDLQTGNLQRLTPFNADPSDPSASPDGSQIAYVSKRDGSPQIYRIKSDGTGDRALTDSSEGDNTSPVWSPDGKTILFISTRSGEAEIFRMNADGSNPDVLLPVRGLNATMSWLPDSKSFVFASESKGFSLLFIANSDGNALRQLLTGSVADLYPEVSPDGKTVIFLSDRSSPRGTSSNRQFYLVAVTGGGTRRQNSTGIKNPDPQMRARWSPDGRQLVFSNVVNGNWTLFAMNADGTNIRQITDGGANDGEGGARWLP